MAKIEVLGFDNNIIHDIHYYPPVPNVQGIIDLTVTCGHKFEELHAIRYENGDVVEITDEMLKSTPLWLKLFQLNANNTYKHESEHFVYVFEKSDGFDIGTDVDENNIVTVSVYDRNGTFLGGTGDCHLNDYDFAEKDLDAQFVEGSSWAKELVDDDYPHMSYGDFLKSNDYERDDV